MIKSLDHFVLTVRSLEKTIQFYTSVLGMKEETFGNGRKALRFGDQKINLHEAGNEFEPKALNPLPGSADLCFITDLDMDEVVGRLLKFSIVIKEGPVKRTGALGPILSVYVRDPDNNLVELSQYLN